MVYTDEESKKQPGSKRKHTQQKKNQQVAQSVSECKQAGSRVDALNLHAPLYPQVNEQNAQVRTWPLK